MDFVVCVKLRLFPHQCEWMHVFSGTFFYSLLAEGTHSCFQISQNFFVKHNVFIYVFTVVFLQNNSLNVFLGIRKRIRPEKNE